LYYSLSINFEEYSSYFRCRCHTFILITTSINKSLIFRLNMSYDFTHWCICCKSFLLRPIVSSILVGELQSPRDLHHILIKLYHCSFAVKPTHEIHFRAIIIVLVHDVWNLPIYVCSCSGSGDRVLHLPGYVVVPCGVFLTGEFYYIHNVCHNEGNIKVRFWGILVIVGVMINSTKSLVPGGTVLV
jgi:hypothetical protein